MKTMYPVNQGSLNESLAFIMNFILLWEMISSDYTITCYGLSKSKIDIAQVERKAAQLQDCTVCKGRCLSLSTTATGGSYSCLFHCQTQGKFLLGLDSTPTRNKAHYKTAYPVKCIQIIIDPGPVRVTPPPSVGILETVIFWKTIMCQFKVRLFALWALGRLRVITSCLMTSYKPKIWDCIKF